MREALGRALCHLGLVLIASLLIGRGLVGCGNLDEYYDSKAAGRLSRHSRGAPIDVSEDDSRVVVVNRDVGSVSVFAVTYGGKTGPELRLVREVDKVCNENTSGDRGEPWQVVLRPDGNAAYVICRSEQVVAEIVDIKTERPRPSGRRARVGSEPTGIALTPRATTAWVANWVDGTVQAINLADMTTGELVDLNAVLVDAGYLGAVSPRRGLAHPRSVAISNDGDDDETNEFLVVTEYFSQQRKLPQPLANLDTARVGIIYKIALDARPLTAKVIELPPASLTFKDSNDEDTSCFPNQLQSVTINGNRLQQKIFAYVTSICASPRGPLTVQNPASAPPVACTENKECGAGGGVCAEGKCAPNARNVKTAATPAISVVDLSADAAVDRGTVALNATYWNYYGKVPETSPARRLPLLANDVAFLPGTFAAVVTAAGTDALFRLAFDPAYGQNPVKEVGPGDPIDLTNAATDGFPVVPIGVAVAHRTSNAFVANDGARNVVAIELTATGGAFAGAPGPSTAFPPPEDEADKVARGKRLFSTGTDTWSQDKQGWGACAECHIDGLTDNVTWSFPRGPRQSSSLDAFFEKQGQKRQRNFGWNASLDEASDLEVNVIRNMFGGAGIIFKLPPNDGEPEDLKDFVGLNRSTSSVARTNKSRRWEFTDAYLRSIRTPRRPTGLDPEAVKRGRAVAERARCQGCHGGPLWTISTRFYTPDPTGAANEALKTTAWPPLNGLPSAVLPILETGNPTMRYREGKEKPQLDSLVCALRNVDTYGLAEEAGVAVVEKRENGKDAQGGRGEDASAPLGYNPPSLLGLSVGAPFLHAGNARTLEALFDDRFVGHHGALVGRAPLRPSDRDDLIVFLLALDGRPDAPEPFDIPELGPFGGSICPP